MSELIIADPKTADLLEFVPLDAAYERMIENAFITEIEGKDVQTKLADFNYTIDDNVYDSVSLGESRNLFRAFINEQHYYENTLKMVFMKSAVETYTGNDSSMISATELDTLIYVFSVAFGKEYYTERLNDIISIKVENVQSNSAEMQYHLKIVFNDEAVRIYDNYEQARLEKLLARQNASAYIKNNVPNNKNWSYSDILRLFCLYFRYSQLHRRPSFEHGTDNDMLKYILCLKRRFLIHYLRRRIIQKPAPRKYIRKVLAGNEVKIRLPNKTKKLCPLFLHNYLRISLASVGHLRSDFDLSKKLDIVNIYHPEDHKELINFLTIYAIVEEMNSVFKGGMPYTLYSTILYGFYEEVKKRYQMLIRHNFTIIIRGFRFPSNMKPEDYMMWIGHKFPHDIHNLTLSEKEKKEKVEEKVDKQIIFEVLLKLKKNFLEKVHKVTKKFFEKHIN